MFCVADTLLRNKDIHSFIHSFTYECYRIIFVIPIRLLLAEGKCNFYAVQGATATHRKQSREQGVVTPCSRCRAPPERRGFPLTGDKLIPNSAL